MFLSLFVISILYTVSSVTITLPSIRWNSPATIQTTVMSFSHAYTQTLTHVPPTPCYSHRQSPTNNPTVVLVSPLSFVIHRSEVKPTTPEQRRKKKFTPFPFYAPTEAHCSETSNETEEENKEHPDQLTANTPIPTTKNLDGCRSALIHTAAARNFDHNQLSLSQFSIALFYYVVSVRECVYDTLQEWLPSTCSFSTLSVHSQLCTTFTALQVITYSLQSIQSLILHELRLILCSCWISNI